MRNQRPYLTLDHQGAVGQGQVAGEWRARRQARRNDAVQAEAMLGNIVDRTDDLVTAFEREAPGDGHWETIPVATIPLRAKGEAQHSHRQSRVNRSPEDIRDQGIERQRAIQGEEHYADGNRANVGGGHQPLRQGEAGTRLQRAAFGRHLETQARKDQRECAPGKCRETRHVVLLDVQSSAEAPADLLEHPKGQQVIGNEVQEERPCRR